MWLQQELRHNLQFAMALDFPLPTTFVTDNGTRYLPLIFFSKSETLQLSRMREQLRIANNRGMGDWVTGVVKS